MDFVDVLEVVSAVFWKLKAQPYVNSDFIQEAITGAEAAVTRDLGWNKYYFLTYDHELIKELLKKLLDAVYKMEDYAETITLTTRRRSLRKMGFGKRYIFILRQMLNSKATVDFGIESPIRLSEIDDAIKPLMNIKESGVSRGEESDVVIGLEEDKRKMVTWLTDTNSRPNLGFILISGQTGSGKTTLATEIYKSREIERHFEFRAWVSVDSEDSVSNLRSILQKITGDSAVDMESTVTKLEEKICAILQNKRWLVVVDNVQNPYLFKTIPGSGKTRRGSALSDEGNGSRVIMTMRSKDLIPHFVDKHPSLSYVLQPLQDEDAWHLFLKKVPDNVLSSHDLDMLKSKIIAICQGIPRAIVVLGRLLSTKKLDEEWLAVLEHPTDGKILALMNSDLTFGLRPCLLYFGFFPKGYEIPVRRLLRLWLAEGLIVTDYPNPEEIAERNLIYCIVKGIIEIGELRKDGINPKTCRMTGIVHDMCSSKAEDIGLVHIGRTISDEHKAASSSGFRVRGLADDDGDIKNYPREDSYIQHLRSYLSLNNQKKDAPAMEIGNFLNKVIGHRGFGLLKVLDLERVYKPKLPHNLGKLYLLRYLGLRRTFLDTLPHSVSELSYLETLDLKHTYISSLPNSIWNMEYLRHLCLNEIRLDLPAASVSLTKLQTLSGFVVDNKSPVKSGLDRSTNLRKLDLTFHLDSVEELNGWIAGLKELKSLKLRSKKEYGRPSKLALKPLSGLENLESLYLLGELPELHYQYFPKRLKVLTLSVSHLIEDPMPILGQLPLLSALRLLANSYTGKEIVCHNGSFQSLKILKLWMLKELERWTVRQGAMQNLEELEMRCCHKLKELPDYLCHIEKINLTNMQNEFVVNVRAKIPEENSSILETQQLRDVLCQYCQDNLNQV